MARCEMCGIDSKLYRAEIEGSILAVCQSCGKFGKVLGAAGPRPLKTQHHQRPQRPLYGKVEEVDETLVEDFSNIIKKKRESLNLKQDELAKKINEKVSILHKIETGHFEPSLKLARKLERFLKIRILEQIGDQSVGKAKEDGEAFTLGDFIKKK